MAAGATLCRPEGARYLSSPLIDPSVIVGFVVTRESHWPAVGVIAFGGLLIHAQFQLADEARYHT
jgi:hypothetical protein